jgi:phosphatidylethanolamine-binding protein (PEBP) family uncharacterized protein
MEKIAPITQNIATGVQGTDYMGTALGNRLANADQYKDKKAFLKDAGKDIAVAAAVQEVITKVPVAGIVVGVGVQGYQLAKIAASDSLQDEEKWIQAGHSLLNTAVNIGTGVAGFWGGVQVGTVLGIAGGPLAVITGLAGGIAGGLGGGLIMRKFAKRLELKSPAFENDARLPESFETMGSNPPLQWKNVPPETESFVVMMTVNDKEIHWLLKNIPGTVREIDEVHDGPGVSLYPYHGITRNEQGVKIKIDFTVYALKVPMIGVPSDMKDNCLAMSTLTCYA